MSVTSGVPCRKVFTDTLLELAQTDRNIVVLASDSRGSVTLNQFFEKLPAQSIETGIAEQNMVGIASGLAMMGKKPFVCAPACFLSMRSVEQVKVDIAYSGTNVKLIGISGGVSYGALGSTHHSVQDIAVMRAIPGMAVLLPCDNYQTRFFTRLMAEYDGPVYIRMGRGPVPDVYSDEREFVFGQAVRLTEGQDITLIAAGETVRVGLDAVGILRQRGIQARMLDMHTIKPLDRNAIISASRETQAIITIEEHSIFGGLGAAVAEVVSTEHPCKMRILGIPDEPCVTGNSQQIFEHYGLTGEQVAQQAMMLLGQP